jgi:hypothetical protein
MAAVETDPFLDRLAALIREVTDQNVPSAAPLVQQVADALRLTLPQVGDAEIGAVLMVAADHMNRVNTLMGDSLSAREVINPLLILGERLYRDGTAEPPAGPEQE